MADIVAGGSFNRAGGVSAHDTATVQIGDSFSPRIFHGGYHNHDSDNGVTRDSILRKLALHSYKERKDINPERVPNTCEWFLSHPRYKQWRQHPNSSMLRVSADPGCGKSVLAKYLVDEELRTTGTSTTCYFFFKDGLDNQSSAAMALRCIIHQILTSYLLNSAIELWDIIVKISLNPEASEVVIVLDAFDECSQAGRVELEKIISALTKSSRVAAEAWRVLICLSYIWREENEEEIRLIANEIDLVIAARVKDLAARLELTPDETESLRIRLSGFNNRTYLWVYLTLDVIENAERPSHNGISSIIEHLPQSVSDYYEKVLARSSDEVKARKLLEVMLAATRPLKLVEIAEALELKEHYSSYAEIQVEEPKVQRHLRDLCGLFIVVINDEVFFLHQTAREFLLPSKTPRPSEGRRHPSTASYKAEHASFSSWQWAHTIQMRQAQSILGQRCVKYLLLSDLSDDPDTSQHQHGAGGPAPAFAFLTYASNNWYKHCRGAGFAGIPAQALMWLIGSPISEANSCVWTRKHGARRDLTDLTPLMLTSNFGLTPAVNSLLKADPGSAKKTCGRSGRSALSYAAEQGVDDIVQLLLHSSRHKLRKIFGVASKYVDKSDVNGQTPLSFAALNGHTVVARRLLEAGARFDVKDICQGTPASYGLCSDDDDMVKLMHDYSSQSNQKLPDESLADILASAIRWNRSRIITRIISTRRVKATSKWPSWVDAEDPAFKQTSYYITYVTLVCSHPSGRPRRVSPLTVGQLAALSGKMSFFEAFEDIGDPVDVLRCDEANGSTLLHWAAARSEDSGKMIEKLLSLGAKVDQADTIGGYTPLPWALQEDRYDNAGLLLSHGADVEIRTLHHESAFKMGCWPRNAVVFLQYDKDFFGLADLADDEKVLLSDFVLTYKGLRSQLPVRPLKASRRYIKKIAAEVQDAASQGVMSGIIEEERNYMQSLYHWAMAFRSQADFHLCHLAAAAAAFWGRYDVLNCLLRRGLTGTFQDNLGRTLLHLLPPPKEASLLLRAGTDPNMKDKQGRTALHEAVWSGQTPLIDLLLRRGATQA